MSLHNSPTEYGLVSRLFHWGMALIMIGLLVVGLLLEDLRSPPLYGVHKSLGMAIIFLTLARIAWHTVSKKPALVETLKPWEKKLAMGMHHMLYLLMIAMPFSGWLMSSAGGHPVTFFGLVQFPDLVAPDKELKETLEEVHEVIGNLIIVIVGLHAAAAIKHHVKDRDATLRRMLPFLKG